MNDKPSNKQTKVREKVLTFSCGAPKGCRNRSSTVENRLRNEFLSSLGPVRGLLLQLWLLTQPTVDTLFFVSQSRRLSRNDRSSQATKCYVPRERHDGHGIRNCTYSYDC